MTLVNGDQTPEERREKYWLCRTAGVQPRMARAMRDWKLGAIERRLQDVLNNQKLIGVNQDDKS